MQCPSSFDLIVNFESIAQLALTVHPLNSFRCSFCSWSVFRYSKSWSPPRRAWITAAMDDACSRILSHCSFCQLLSGLLIVFTLYLQIKQLSTRHALLFWPRSRFYRPCANFHLHRFAITFLSSSWSSRQSETLSTQKLEFPKKTLSKTTFSLLKKTLSKTTFSLLKKNMVFVSSLLRHLISKASLP